MTLSKITFDSSVKFILKGEQTRENKPEPIKNKSTSKKQNESISQNNKKFLNNMAAGGFVYFYNSICIFIILLI